MASNEFKEINWDTDDWYLFGLREEAEYKSKKADKEC